MTPEATVRAANELAHRSAPEAALRALAAQIVHGVSDVRREAPQKIAEWIRANVRYFQESPGIETLQGPFTTLPSTLRVGNFQFSGNGVGDCDDLAILFATLCRAIGLHGYVAAIAPHPYDGGGFMHAIGYCRDSRRFYELSKDEAYGGIPNKPVEILAPPVGTSATYFCPVEGVYHRVINDTKNPALSYDTAAVFAAPREAVRTTNDMTRSAAVFATPRDRARMGATLPDNSGGFFGKSPTVTAANAPPTRNSPQMREMMGDLVSQATPLLRDMGLDPSAVFGANPNSTGADGVLQLGMAGLQLGAQEAGDTTAGGRVLGTIAAVLPAALMPPPNPVAIIGACVAISGAVGKEVAAARRMNKKQEELGARAVDLTREIITLCLGAPTRGVKDDGCKALLMMYRMLECAPIFADNYGARSGNFRDVVKVSTYSDVLARTSSGPDSRVGLKQLERYGLPTAADRQYCEAKNVGFFDRTTWAKGMNYVGGKTLTAPVNMLTDQVEQIRRTKTMIEAVGRASGFSGEALLDLRLGMFWSLLAQIIPLGITSVVQRTAETKTANAVALQQVAVPISYDTFWQGVQPTFQQSPADIVTPAALAFGATAEEFERGMIGQYLTLAGLQNYKIFESAVAPTEQGWDFDAPATPAVVAKRAGGGLLAAAALAAGAYFVTMG
jgi:hypothetical protein